MKEIQFLMKFYQQSLIIIDIGVIKEMINFNNKEKRRLVFLLRKRLIHMKKEIDITQKLINQYSFQSKRLENIQERLIKIIEMVWVHENLLDQWNAPSLNELDKEFRLKNI